VGVGDKGVRWGMEHEKIRMATSNMIFAKL
jgi:hypothetical protein